MMKYIPLLELPVLIIMVAFRALMLRKHGIKTIVFGETNKSDFIIVPIVLFFLYGISSSVFDLPFPLILKSCFLENSVLRICAIVFCTVSLLWFFITLKIFGRSFRVGIDENTNDTLITHGTFSMSRNPIYAAFMVFFMGICMAYPNVITIVFFILLIVTVHRQVLREEDFLKRHYGKEYEEYCARVRRYI
ncbi:MAG: isoprenylcysteine carboxylmethyltransferase family protein [Spirochaetaceae bacterium]|jgi:protein-S-isoprenylcysteine O-methyltransferase Ste14|nr:isoprenylcysteine carboxylmethyltransferase family protein [Spirochaetaceae bacterium]